VPYTKEEIHGKIMRDIEAWAKTAVVNAKDPKRRELFAYAEGIEWGSASGAIWAYFFADRITYEELQEYLTCITTGKEEA
jgi:hypothetical protein